jgi:hypothetical protein
MNWETTRATLGCIWISICAMGTLRYAETILETVGSLIFIIGGTAFIAVPLIILFKVASPRRQGNHCRAH